MVGQFSCDVKLWPGQLRSINGGVSDMGYILNHICLWYITVHVSSHVLYVLKLVQGQMTYYSNIRSFATVFKYMKLHLNVRPCPHPAIKGCVPLLLHAKDLTEVPFLSLSLHNKDLISLSRASSWRFIVDKRSQNKRVRKCDLENTHATSIRTVIHFDGQMFKCKISIRPKSI